MKVRVKSDNSITVIEKSKKDYDFNGNKGTTYKAICMVKHGDETQVDELRVTEPVYANLKPMTLYDFSGVYDTRNGRLEFDLSTPAQSPAK